MKHLILLLLCTTILSACNTPSTVENMSRTLPIETFADSLIQSHIDSSNISGAGIFVAQNGKTLIHKGYGMAELEFGIPMPEDASFEIGSVTKQFTSAAILMLEKEEKLSLDDDFTKYVDFDTKGRIVTINQLLNHTSGIPGYTEIDEFENLAYQQLDTDTLLRIVESKKFLFEPGENLIYNNTGFFLLGLIIEKTSGKTYEEYLSEKIFRPLGMDNTYYCSSKKERKKKAYGYGYTPED